MRAYTVLMWLLVLLVTVATGSVPVYMRDIPSFPADWFADEIQNNAELARLIVHKFIDSNQDGELSADELLRPLFERPQAAPYK